MHECVLNHFSRVQLFCDPLDCNPPSSSVHGTSRARILGSICHFLLKVIFPIQGLNPCLWWFLPCRWILYHWTTREALRCFINNSKTKHLFFALQPNWYLARKTENPINKVPCLHTSRPGFIRCNICGFFLSSSPGNALTYRHLGCSFWLTKKPTPVSSRPGNRRILTAEALWWKKRETWLRSPSPNTFFASPKERAFSTDKWGFSISVWGQFFPQKVNHTQLVTWAHKITKQETAKGFETGNKQKNRILCFCLSKYPFAVPFPTYRIGTWDQVLLLLLPAILIERQDLFWPHMLKNSCSYN